jgi:Peptidase family M28
MHKWCLAVAMVVTLNLAACSDGSNSSGDGDSALRPEISVDGHRMLQIVEALSDTASGGRGPGTEGARQAQEYISQQLDGMSGILSGAEDSWRQPVPDGYTGGGEEPNTPEPPPCPGPQCPDSGPTPIEPIDLGAATFETAEATEVSHTLNYANILGVIEGSDPELSFEFIVLSAHYDHFPPDDDGNVYPGASDNAAGVAIVLEIARVLAASRDRPARSILIALWDLEELKFLGSEYFVNYPTVSLDKIHTMINLDGWGDSITPSLKNIGFAIGADRVPLIESLLEPTYLEDETFEFMPVSALLFPPRSDHVSFLDNSIPAIHLTSGAHAQRYHSVDDTPDHVNPEVLESGAYKIMSLVTALANDVSGDSDLLSGDTTYYEGDVRTLRRIGDIWIRHPEDLEERAPDLLADAPDIMARLDFWLENPPENKTETRQYFFEIYADLLARIAVAGLVPL